MNRDDAILAIIHERQRQVVLWGEQQHAPLLAILIEEVGEVAAELNEAFITGKPDKEALKRELIQVAAVAVKWLETL